MTELKTSQRVVAVAVILVSGLVMVVMFAWLANDRKSAQQAAVPRAQSGNAPDQGVLVHLRLSDSKFGSEADLAAIHRLEYELQTAIDRARVGEFDGNEIGEGKCVLYMYGPDADKLFTAIESVLRTSAIAKAGWVIRRYGTADDPDAREVRLDL